MGICVSEPKFETSQQAWPEFERVTIAVDTECLRRLLQSRQLCAEQFSCQDCRSKACVRRLLLQNL